MAFHAHGLAGIRPALGDAALEHPGVAAQQRALLAIAQSNAFHGRRLSATLLHTGQLAAARTLQAEIAQLTPPQGKEDGNELLRAMHSIVLARLNAELAQRDGRTDVAVAAAQAAVAAEDAVEAREPPTPRCGPPAQAEHGPPPQAARTWQAACTAWEVVSNSGMSRERSEIGDAERVDPL